MVTLACALVAARQVRVAKWAPPGGWVIHTAVGQPRGSTQQMSFCIVTPMQPDTSTVLP